MQNLSTRKSLTPQRELLETKLSLATPEEMKTALGKKGVMDYKRFTIRQGNEKIETQI